MILTRSTRLVQPQGPVELDTSNPLTSGVVVAWVPGSSRNIQDGKPASVNGVLSVGPYGYMQTTTGTQKAFLVPDAPSQRTTTFTSYAILRRVSTLQSNFDGVGKNWQNNTSPTFVSDTVAYNVTTGTGQNSIRAVFGRAGGNAATTVYSGQETSEWHSIASTHDGSMGSLYVGGALRSTVAVQPVVYGSSGDNSFGTNTSGKSGSMEYSLVLRWNRALSASEIALLESNPWQLFRPVQRRVYFDMGAGGGDVVLAGSSASQVNTSSSGAITQTHVLSGASVDQSNTSTSGAIGQSIILTGASVAQGNATTSGSVAQTHLLIGSNCQQANTSTSGAVVQTGDLIGANCAQVNTSSSGSISQTHVLSGASCIQPNTTTSGAVIIVSVVILTGANCAQGNTTTTGSTSQSHVLIGAPVAIDHIATASSIVQTHILSGADCSQSNYSTTGSINQVVIPSQFVASVPAGVFSARAPAGEYSATVPEGNYRASI